MKEGRLESEEFAKKLYEALRAGLDDRFWGPLEWQNLVLLDVAPQKDISYSLACPDCRSEVRRAGARGLYQCTQCEFIGWAYDCAFVNLIEIKK